MDLATATRDGDGIHSMVPDERMTDSARRRRLTYARQPGVRLLQGEFGFYSLDAWAKQGMPANVSLDELFGFEPTGNFALFGLGWCEAAFCPRFEVKILEDRGETEVEQDTAGRRVLYFKGRRDGFMPEYVGHPVTDMKSWQENVKWRLDPNSPGRFDGLDQQMQQATVAAGRGEMITQQLIGGYMYLRSLIGPEELMYAWYDQPELIHDCMRTWYELADAVIARHQEHVTIDEIFFAEDICYNHGLLCSPEMMKEFLLPYYQQLIANVKSRQLDRSRHLYVHIDTDGDCRPAIPIYREAIGMDVMSPFEVASGCDVVEIGRQYPWLCIRGGIDKRVLAAGRQAIDAMVERILPTMKARGGYIPCCDHGVPAEVPYQDYLHYRKRCLELA